MKVVFRTAVAPTFQDLEGQEAKLDDFEYERLEIRVTEGKYSLQWHCEGVKYAFAKKTQAWIYDGPAESFFTQEELPVEFTEHEVLCCSGPFGDFEGVDAVEQYLDAQQRFEDVASPVYRALEITGVISHGGHQERWWTENLAMFASNRNHSVEFASTKTVEKLLHHPLMKRAYRSLCERPADWRITKHQFAALVAHLRATTPSYNPHPVPLW